MAQGPMSSISVTIWITAFTGLSKKLPLDFEEILWRAGVWPDQLIITFW